MQTETEQLTVVITGGSGYIGRLLCEKLVSLNYNVINIDRNKKEIPGVTQYPFDLSNNQVKGLLALLKPHALIHLASDNPQTNSNATVSTVYQINVADTINMINHAVGSGVKNFVLSGYTAVSGVSDVYLNSKNTLDSIISDYADAYDIKFLSLKYPEVVGLDPNSRDHTETQFTRLIRDIVKNNPVQLENTTKKYIHVLDVVDAHAHALADVVTGTNGAIELNSELEYTDLEIAAIVHGQMQSKTSESGSANTQQNRSMAHTIYHTLAWVKKHR